MSYTKESYTKEIVCLANSRRPSARCIAGIERNSSGWGGWIRPVSARDSGGVSEADRSYEDGSDPKILDTISIQFLSPLPVEHQKENHLIDAHCYWRKTGTMTWDELGKLVEQVTGPLWLNGSSSFNGQNDRVPEEKAKNLSGSLVLIQPEDLVLSVSREGYGSSRLKVRAKFHLQNQAYSLTVTDPTIERKLVRHGVKDHPMKKKDAYLCISLGEKFKGSCYKLVACIIQQPT